MTGDDDGHPHDADDDQGESRPAQRRGVDSTRQQALTIECGVDAEGEQACSKEAEDDAADDAASTCDQPEPGDRSSGHCQGNGSAKRTRRRVFSAVIRAGAEG